MVSIGSMLQPDQRISHFSQDASSHHLLTAFKINSEYSSNISGVYYLFCVLCRIQRSLQTDLDSQILSQVHNKKKKK